MRDSVRPAYRSKRDVRKRVGMNIQRKRLARGLSQQELADRAGSSLKHLNQVEGGKVDVGASVLYSIAVALSVNVGELFVARRHRASDSDGFLMTEQELLQFEQTMRRVRTRPHSLRKDLA